LQSPSKVVAKPQARRFVGDLVESKALFDRHGFGRVNPWSRPRSDVPFFVALALLGGVYVVLVAALLLADLFATTPSHILAALASPEIRYSVRLSLTASGLSCARIGVGRGAARLSARANALPRARRSSNSWWTCRWYCRRWCWG